MKIETCTSDPDDLLESYRPSDEAAWKLMISGFWSVDPYHSGYIAYYLARTGESTWIMDSVARNAELDGVTEEDVEQGGLNDDQLQALSETTLEEAQAIRYERIVAICRDAPPEADDRFIAHMLYSAVRIAGGRMVDEPDDHWDDVFGLWSAS